MRLSAKELIQPISDDLPCGENLEYDPDFQQMEAMLQSKSEQEFGDTVIAGSGPDWKGVGKQAADLLKRTRDLRVLSYATISQLHTDGLGAFRDALEALNACLETYWDIIYPELDAEDNNDATFLCVILKSQKARLMLSKARIPRISQLSRAHSVKRVRMTWLRWVPR